MTSKMIFDIRKYTGYKISIFLYYILKNHFLTFKYYITQILPIWRKNP